MTQLETETVTINDIGPVDAFSFDLPPAGGLVRILGENGIGKTTILNTIEVLSTGAGDLRKREGTKIGTANGFGRSLKVRKRTLKEGELTIEGAVDLDLAVLHTPKLKTAVGRDNVRISALVKLAGGTDPEIEDFHHLITDRAIFDEIVGEEARGAKDIVAMSLKVKRDIETRARKHETSAEVLFTRSKAKKAAAAGIDVASEHDRETLGAKLETAIAGATELRQKLLAHQDAVDAANAAADLIDEANKEYDGKTAAEAESAYVAAESAADDAIAAEEAGRDALIALEMSREKTLSAQTLAVTELNAAKHHESTIAKWRESLIVGDSPVSSEDIATGDVAVENAKREAEEGVRIRDAITALADAKEDKEEAQTETRRAVEFRNAAKSTGDVIADAVAKIPDCPLTVTFDDDGDPRLTIPTSRGPLTKFDELSDGERWKTIVPLAIGDNSVVVLPQAAYGELDPNNQGIIHKAALGRGWVVTAEATDGPLRAEVFNGDM